MHRLTKLLTALVLATAPVAVSLALPQAALAKARRRRAGETLPGDVLHNGPNVNYAAQRLRRPPEGYGWFALDGVFVLASLSSGLILEVAQ